MALGGVISQLTSGRERPPHPPRGTYENRLPWLEASYVNSGHFRRMLDPTYRTPHGVGRLPFGVELPPVGGHQESRFDDALGINRTNWIALEHQISEGIHTAPGYVGQDGRYYAPIPVVGSEGRALVLETIWIIGEDPWGNGIIDLTYIRPPLTRSEGG